MNEGKQAARRLHPVVAPLLYVLTVGLVVAVLVIVSSGMVGFMVGAAFAGCSAWPWYRLELRLRRRYFVPPSSD